MCWQVQESLPSQFLEADEELNQSTMSGEAVGAEDVVTQQQHHSDVIEETVEEQVTDSDMVHQEVVGADVTEDGQVILTSQQVSGADATEDGQVVLTSQEVVSTDVTGEALTSQEADSNSVLVTSQTGEEFLVPIEEGTVEETV